MFNYRDFWPRQLKRGGLVKKAQWQPFEMAMKKANAWVKKEGVKVINIETVVLPNVWESDLGPEDAKFNTYTDSECIWYQVVRVWYEEKA